MPPGGSGLGGCPRRPPSLAGPLPPPPPPPLLPLLLLLLLLLLGAAEGARGMLSFKPTFSLYSFIFIRRLYNSSLSALRVVSSAYLRLLIFLPAILILACASSSPVFHMMYSAYKLSKQGDNIQP